MYSFSEAAHLARVSAGTVRNWLFGYSARDGAGQPPLFRPPLDQGARVSFLQLIEIMVAGRLRKAEHASFKKIYLAYQNARDEYPQLEYPFAHIELEAVGGHIIHLLHGKRSTGSYQTLDVPADGREQGDRGPTMQQPELWTLPGMLELRKVTDQLDFEHDLASRWWPVGKDVPIVIDPQFGSGVPTIYGRGVTVSTIHKRFVEGRLDIEFLMEDYQLERDQIEHAIRYGRLLAA